MGAVVAIHGGADGLTMGKNRDRFYLPLRRLELVIPDAYDFVHGRRGRRKLLFQAVVVKHCIVMGEQGVLDLNLSCKEVG